MIILTEHAAFERLRDGLKMAQDGAKMIAVHRPDQAHQWNKMADVYAVSMQAVWKLMEEAASKGLKQ